MGSLNKKQIMIIIVVGVIFVVVIGMYLYNVYGQNQTEEMANFYEEEEEKEVVAKEEENKKIVVHIVGEVNEPGIVEIEEGSRIADVVEEAGGITSQADVNKINLAYVVEDGQKIIIPNQEEVENNSGFSYISSASGNYIEDSMLSNKGEDRVNINQATQTQLEELPGIGPSTALKIVEYRKENGDFREVEEIKNVNGIGEAKYEKIKDCICVK